MINKIYFSKKEIDLNLISIKAEIPTDLIENQTLKKPFTTMLQKSINKNEVFKTLLDNAAPIDFIMKSKNQVAINLKNELILATDQKHIEILEAKLEKLFPKPLQQYVIIINELLETSENIGLAVAVTNQKIRFFNREYWDDISNEEFTGFLSDFSERSGLNPLEAQQFKVKEFLLNSS